MEIIIAQLKYDLLSIESKLNSIKDTELKMEQWVGKPIYNSCEDLIKKWNEEITEHTLMFNNYAVKFKKATR